LRYPAPQPVGSGSDDAGASGMMVAPGTYTVTMSKRVDGVVTELSSPQSFEVVPLYDGALEGTSYADVASFWRSLEDAVRESSAVQTALSNALETARAMHVALDRATAPAGDLDGRLHDALQDLLELDGDLNGLRSKREPGEKTRPTVGDRLFRVSLGVERSTYGPTPTHREQLQIVADQLVGFRSRLEMLQERLRGLGVELTASGAPWVDGQPLPRGNR
ncbi:MAG: glycosyl hydrolase, partial [Rhodothermales bacterium]|nr:glycosyl hydrolase [Rhodothermales bacterium]